ncbi:MAG: nitroreductase family protein [Polyangiaceae bacterium]|jgi:nitroreductase
MTIDSDASISSTANAYSAAGGMGGSWSDLHPSAAGSKGALESQTSAFYDVIFRRRSIRNYRCDPISEDVLARILGAALRAPSARNKQPWHYVVVTDSRIRARLRRAYDREWFFNAPVIVCACGEPSRNPANPSARDYRDIDVSISLDHLVLAATAEGLGTCWVGAFDAGVVRAELRIPDGIDPLIMTPLGYPHEAPPPRERRPLREVVHRNLWGSP